MYGLFLLGAALPAPVALAFLLGGDRPRLNTVDYQRIGDARAFNHHVGTRLLLPIIVALACAAQSYLHPRMSVPLLFLLPLSILATVIWVSAGSRRFSRS